MDVSIREWYKNEVIFLTGGSGYIGKGIIFKLLQCGTGKIFLLVRAKKGQDPEERLDVLAKHWIYDSLRAEGIDVRSKLFAVAGDVTVPLLGISERDRIILQREVTVVIHTAASIRFDDPLKTAVFYNLRSARDLVDLAKGIKNLKILNHVSTAYCNIDQMYNGHTIYEKLYPAKMDWRKLIEFVENTPEELVSAVEAKVIDQLVNSYLFTKHLSEKVFEEAAHFIPVTITRPPIVMGSLKEPDPGWFDNLTSAIVIVAGVGKGVLRANTGNEKVFKAYVPLDVTVNTILASSWNQALAKKGGADGQVQIFNETHILFSDWNIYEWAAKLFANFPMHNALWHLVYLNTSNLNVFLFYHIFLHLIPGLFFDAILKLTGNKPRLLKIYRKMYVAIFNLFPIVMVSDEFDCTNYKRLKEVIPENEKRIFELDFPSSDEQVYSWMSQQIIGIRKFLGEPPEPSPQDFVHNKRLYWLHVSFCAVWVLLFLWLFPLRLLAAPFLYVVDSVLDNF